MYRKRLQGPSNLSGLDENPVRIKQSCLYNTYNHKLQFVTYQSSVVKFLIDFALFHLTRLLKILQKELLGAGLGKVHD